MELPANLAILLIRQFHQSCWNGEKSALGDEFESSGIVPEWCGRVRQTVLITNGAAYLAHCLPRSNASHALLKLVVVIHQLVDELDQPFELLFRH